MTRHVHIYENDGVSARAFVSREEDHYFVAVWASRQDLFQIDPHCDQWAQGLMESIGRPMRLEVHGPGFREPTLIFY